MAHGNAKLTDKQWEEIERRFMDDESASELAREFKVTEGAIRYKFATKKKTVKSLANQIVTVEKALEAEPIPTRLYASQYAAKLLSISSDMLEGSALAAGNFRKLTFIAQKQLDKVNESNADDVVENADRIKTAAILTSMANDAAKTPIALLTANKDAAKDARMDDVDKPKTLAHFYGEQAHVS